MLGLAGALTAGAAGAQWQRPVDCATLSVRLVGIPEAAGARCSGDETHSNELIDASGPGRVLVIRHQSSGFNAYLQREEVTHIVRKLTGAAVLEGMSRRFKLGRFDVVAYRAASSAAALPTVCFAFLNYAGHVEHTTGYRHAIIGSYCDLTGTEPTDAQIGQLLGAIEADFW